MADDGDVIKINNEFRDAVLPVTVFVGIEVFVAFFGNLIVLYVFLFRYHYCTFRYFVMCLAVVDLISSLTTMPGEMVTQLYWYNYPIPELCKAKSFFNVFTVSGEALCLMAIAVDRYLKVCRPLGKQIMPNNAKYICGVIYVCAIVFAIPVAIFWGTHSHGQKYNGTTINVTVCEKDAKFEKTDQPFQYSVSIEVILSISLVFMLGLYCLIARSLVQNRRQSRAYSSTSREERVVGVPDVTIEVTNESMHIEDRAGDTPGNVRKVRSAFGVDSRVVRKTKIMFILTVAFIITTILYLTLLSFIARPDDILQTLTNTEKSFYFFFFRLYFINHVINPIVYGILDMEFRKHLKNIKDSILLRLKASR